MADQFEAWITKYVLTQGMDRCVVETCGDDMVSVVGAKYRTLYHKPDWHRTEAEANERVRKMIAAKRKSIAKQVARLDELERRLGAGDQEGAE